MWCPFSCNMEAERKFGFKMACLQISIRKQAMLFKQIICLLSVKF